jgi:hypothetical protein
MKTYKGVEVCLQHSWRQHSMEVSGQFHAPGSFTPEKYPPVPIV